MSKPKISDIAKEAGVSSATVSYVLNNNPHQKINEKTKKKILQIASLLGYTKNVYASALASGKTSLIGIYTKESSFSLKNAQTFSFIERLTVYLRHKGYTTVLLSADETENINFVDAILTFDISEEDFVTICNNVYIPVIAIDTKPHENWIFAVLSTYPDEIKENALFVTFKGNSSYVMGEIEKHHPGTKFISSYGDIEPLRKDSREMVTASPVLYSLLKELNLNVTLIPDKMDIRFETITKFIEQAEKHEDIETHICEL